MTEQTHLLHVGDKAYHLRRGLVGTVLHVSTRRGGTALLRHADGTEKSYPVSELRVRDPESGDMTRKCRVE